jgi:DNA replication protein DnaC
VDQRASKVGCGAVAVRLWRLQGENLRRSTIITSQIPVDKWHELIGDPTYADAILDRIVHNSHRINLTGHSLRRSRAAKACKD